MSAVQKHSELPAYSEKDISSRDGNDTATDDNAHHDFTNDDTSSLTIPLNESPWKYKALAFMCALFMSAGSHYFNNTLSAFKSTLKKEMSLSNTDFGVLTSTVFLMNTIMPLAGGVTMDSIGTGVGALISVILILAGTILAGVAANVNKYGVLVFSRVVFGLGSGMVVTAQEVILGHWFRGTGLSTTLGFQLATSKFFGWLAQSTVLHVKENTGFWGNAFWVSAGLSGFSLILVIVYILTLRRVEVYNEGVKRDRQLKKVEAMVAQGQDRSEAEANATAALRPKQKESLLARYKRSFENVLQFPDAYWWTPFNLFLFGSVWTPFLIIATEFIEKKWHVKGIIAAWKSSISLAIPIAVSPITGMYIDRFGHRGYVCIVAAILLIISQVLLAYSSVDPLVGMSLFSLSLTIGPVAINSAVALILPPQYMGTGLGLVKVGLNTGVTIFDVLIGRVQDGTGDDSYRRVSVMLIIVSCLTLLNAAAFAIADKKFLDGVLSIGYKTRKQVMDKRTADHAKLQRERHSLGLTGRKLLTPRKVLIYSIVVCLFILAWVLYGVFLFGRFEA
ncbi:MFS general substrate transporter [Ramicandelaber brevisporus]|nr:MFS general substrate transporter [Ramicandelaber brevisporus]